MDINENNLFDKLYSFSEKYGEIFEMKILHQTFVSLNSESLIRKALATEPYTRFMNERTKFFYGESMLYGSQSVFTYGDPYSKVYNGMRKGMVKGLHVYGQEGFNKFEENIQLELCRLNNKIESFGDCDFDVVALIQRSLTNVTSQLLIGESLSDDDKDVNMFWDYVAGINVFVNASVNNILTFMPFLRYAPSFKSKYDFMSRGKDTIIERFFKSRKNNATGSSEGLVDYLLDEQRKTIEEGKEVIFTDERIISNILETVGAGILTTWSVLTSSILCLVNHPEYQDKVFEEIDKNIGRDSSPNHSDKVHCPHLEALELEVHRLITVVPILAGSQCSRDLEFEGYNLSKGTLIIANIWYIHHNPKIWGDPWNFRPERFLDEDGQLLPREHIFRRNCIPFAVGRRQCLGEQFARSRYFLYMATLLRKWKFVGSPGKFGSCDPRDSAYIENKVTYRAKSFFCTAVKR
ncbi:cytochrome P450 2C31-like [Ruditapes philippinarum]|uniref:cytochrome P450 2C31-like n=1 Tax=Ruditapes philippinarum TaxID=129788 RepID=UPI00295B512F|nr:cytochrome P450 2C31-like [Ruditapes philippinarum]